MGPLTVHRQRHGNGDIAMALAVVIHPVAEAINAVTQRRQALTHTPLAIAVQRAHRRRHPLRAPLPGQFRQTMGAGQTAAGLGGEVGEPGHIHWQRPRTVQPGQSPA